MTYHTQIVKYFTIMASIYLVLGTGVGVWIASELAWPWLNFDIPYITFGRLRPVHTNIVVYGFGGCTLLATAYYVVQRTCSTALWSNKMAWFTFWAWNLYVIGAIITLPLGITQSKEYAELEWPLDIVLTAAWLAYTFNFIMTIRQRKISHIYVANWFFLAMMIMFTYLHVVNSLAMPVGYWKSYSLFAGVHDAMVQWPQRDRLLSDRWFSGDHVLLCTQTSEPADLFLPFVGDSLLGVNFRLCLAGCPSFAIYRLARLDRLTGCGDFTGDDYSIVGRRSKRYVHLKRCLG